MRGRMIYMCILILSLCGCRKELCYNHGEHSIGVRVDIRAEWELEWERDYGCGWETNWGLNWNCSYDDLKPQPAKGIRFRAYNQDGNIYDERNLPTEGGCVTLGEEDYSLLLYNNDTEYIVFDDAYSIAHTRATTRTLTRGSYMAMHKNERTINQPDMLYGHYAEHYKGELSTEIREYPVTLKPLVYTYLIRYEFSKGQEYVSLARGALAGMAESVYLYDGHTGDESATILFDCSVEEWGVEARVLTFGVPSYPGDHYKGTEEESRCYSLNLEIKLSNGVLKTYEFDVSEQLVDQPRGGVIVVSGLEVKEEEAVGGFYVGVDGWGDIIDIPLDL